MNKQQALLKLTRAGESLLEDLCQNVSNVSRLTVVDIERILSLQPCITKEGDRWRITNKKKNGGFLNFAKFRKRFPHLVDPENISSL